MTFEQFCEQLKICGRVLGIQRKNGDAEEKIGGSCIMSALNLAMQGKSVLVSTSNTNCKGANNGMGFCDGVPNILGGFGHFISFGRGEGFPKGEHIKKNPELAEEMILGQPQGVMDGFNCLKIEQFDGKEQYDLVTILANPDQLAVLIHIFGFENPSYDNVIAPMSSGCASIFRIPFGEFSQGGLGRAVIGNIDVFSRPHFDKDKVFFTVGGDAFNKMRAVSQDSVLSSHIFNAVKNRL